MTENLTAAPNTVVALTDGMLAYTDALGIVRGRDDEPVTEGKVAWVKSEDAPERDIQFQTTSDDTGMLVGLDDTLDAAWDGLEQVNEEWDDGETYSVTICYDDAELSLVEID